MRRTLVVFALLAASIAVVRCATLAESAGGDSNLPSAGVGPFRKLAPGEVRGVAPYLLDDSTAQFRGPCVLSLDPNSPPTSANVALYFVMKDAQSHDVIGRSHATDGRTFFGATGDLGHAPKQVLASDQSWESPDLGRPSVLQVGSPSAEIRVYYASNGSVGLARSSDGFAFTKASAPVLMQDTLGAITSPSVAVLPDGTFRMMFVQGSSIYEASSTDGATWTRVDADPSTPQMDPVLGPGPAATDLVPGEIPPFDTLAVGDPFLTPRITPANRLQIRVLYTGYSAGDAATPSSAIGFAARYGEGVLSRAPGAIYAVGKHESAPSLFAWSANDPVVTTEAGTTTNAGVLLYVEQNSSDGTYRAIAGAYAPATSTLPLPDPFPDSP